MSATPGGSVLAHESPDDRDRVTDRRPPTQTGQPYGRSYEADAYERLIDDAMDGDARLFARQDGVE